MACHAHIARPLPDGPDWAEAAPGFGEPADPADQPIVLDSVRPHVHWARFSYLADRPRWLLVSRSPGQVELTDARTGETLRHWAGTGAELAALREAAGKETDAATWRRGDGGKSPHPSPLSQGERGVFVGGWVGYLGYELGSAWEGVPAGGPDEIALPRMRWAFYDTVARYDLLTGQWELNAVAMDSDADAEIEQRLDALEARLRQPGRTAGGEDWHRVSSPSADRGVSGVSLSPQPPPFKEEREMAGADRNFTRAEYERAVGRAKDYIGAGDIYQVNLSQRFDWPVAAGDTPGRLFTRLRQSHPGWYSALLQWTGADGKPEAICSASPELFLRVEGDRVITRPIKGTRARRGEPASDGRAREELWRSEKDAAELAMIVDLERNDLGRVCRFGSVRVAEARQLETHANVHHTVATIKGRLADGRDVADLLAAAFPGGSITGAPKIRAMQIIAELEPTARSVYTGCIGYLGADGSAMLNIAIRTVLVRGGRAYVQLGGGIVADSDPAAEYDETIAKAQGLVQATRP